MSIEKMNMARGVRKAPLVLKNCQVVNVFNGQIDRGDIAIDEETILGVGDYEGIREIDMAGKYICPGFIDGHVHIESSYLTPPQFAKLVMPMGTTTIIADPHEIANVCGMDGIRYMLNASEKLPLDVYVMLPSCVPCTDFENSGACLLASDLAELMHHHHVIGLGEMMNYPGVIEGHPVVHDKLTLMKDHPIDGHAPLLAGEALNAYIAAGIKTDHECTTKEELLEKVGKGMYVHIREGSATRNLSALIGGVTEANSRRLLFCTDDKEPMDILEEGHIDHNVRKAITLGLNPITAIQMASLNTAECYGLKRTGAIAPGYAADLLVLSDLETVAIEQVYKKGVLVAEGGEALFEAKSLKDDRVQNTVYIGEVADLSLDLPVPSGVANVIKLIDHEIITDAVVRKVATKDGRFVHDDRLDILKFAVVERHKGTGNVGLGLLEGYGLIHGAIGLTIGHDSHNLIVVGDNDEDMRLAIETLKKQAGGSCLCMDGQVLDALPLEVGGIMTDASLESVMEKVTDMNRLAKDMGVNRNIEPFMTLAFMALPVIPELKLTDKGLFDVRRFDFIPVDVAVKL